MSKSTPARRSIYTPSPMPPSGRSSLSRSQTPTEAMDNLYVGLARTHAVRGITSYALESLGAVAARRQHLVEEFPEVEAMADALITNMVGVMYRVQQNVLNDGTQVIV